MPNVMRTSAKAAPGAGQAAADGPVIEETAGRDERRAADALRLLAFGVALLLVVLLAVTTRAFAREAQHGLLAAATSLPAGLRDLLVAVVQVLVVFAPVAAAAVAVAQRRVDALVRIVPAAALGAAVAWGLTELVLRHSRPDQWPAVLSGRGLLLPAGWPSAVYFAACVAALVAAEPWLSHRWRRGLWSLTVWCVVLMAAAAAIVPLDALAALAVGGVAGSAVLLLGGAPADRPGAAAVADALIRCGLPATALRERPAADQRAGEGIRYTADAEGTTFAVRVLAGEDHDRDLFHRWSRRLLLADPGDTAQEPLTAVEHELLMLVAAGRAGARVAEPVIAFPVEGGGALLVTVEDTAAPPMSAGTVGDSALTAAWRSVAALQEHRIAHRALIPEHILVEGADADEVRLTAFARGRLDASATQLGTDLAVLLATTALLVGTERAVQCAVQGLGKERLATVLPFLQPLALTGPTRRAVAEYDHAAARAAGHRRTLRPGHAPGLLRDLEAAVAAACDVPVAKPAALSRFTWKKALGLLGAFLVVHLILPQLANAGSAVGALRHANWWWVLAAFPTTLLSQVSSAYLQAGTIPERLPLRPNVEVQFAAAFLNRITPNNVGGMAMNLRFLQKAGVESAAATASVGLQSLAGALSNVVVAMVFFAWTGQQHSGVHIGAPSGRWLLPVVAAVLIGCAVFAATGPGRRFFREKVWRFLKAAAETVAAVATSPSKVAEGVFGALGLPLIQIVGLVFCLHALGIGLPFSQVGAVFMAARVVAAAAPVPGGLGALEAALIAGFTALGAAAGPVTSAVLVYRLLSFWLNIPLGAIALGDVQRRAYV